MYPRLNEMIKTKYKNTHRFAETIKDDIKVDRVYRLLNGKSNFNLKDIKVFSKALGIHELQFLIDALENQK